MNKPSSTARNSCQPPASPLHPDTQFFFYDILEPVRCDFLYILNPRVDLALYPAADVLLVCGVWGGGGRGTRHSYHLLQPAQQTPFQSFSEMYSDYASGFRETAC